MNILKLMAERHSVRQYTTQPVEPKKRAIIDALITDINSTTGLNFQVFYDETKCFDSMLAHYGKFSGVKNYIALVGAKSPTLDETVGYWGEHLVLKLQEMGLNTCWVALTHGKTKATTAPGEKLACLISFGYGTTPGVPHKSKPLHDVCNFSDTVPDWFVTGVKAALLAPTAMNQQKFFFTLHPDDSVTLTAGKGFYAKMDMGIVKYHFEVATDKTVN